MAAPKISSSRMKHSNLSRFRIVVPDALDVWLEAEAGVAIESGRMGKQCKHDPYYSHCSSLLCPGCVKRNAWK
ncbi:hypothetical protein LMG29739_03834 [Paraburkholderia solisilvae]|uniref:Uncharacterized protein n=1 Tax=Paraburkholderia solisilvae TaxID=624376 RepID=A0A6J5E9J7_9BURK|nr:hypothetical protein LMG29739_03834 [Paraburkholderia solisilvae]